jgi:CTP:molybdopterin cytidylyltransferase MocA
MRTTLTLDPDVARLLEEEVHRLRRPFKQVVNDAIRRGLAPSLANTPPRPYRTVVHKAELRPGIDPAALNRLADELEDEAVIAKVGKRR